MKLYINGFWGNFISDNEGVTVNPFLELFEKIGLKCDITDSLKDSDILFESHWAHPSLVNIKNWKYTIFFSGERKFGIPENINDYSLVLGTNTNAKNRVAFPLFLPYLKCHPFRTIKIDSLPTKNICAIYTNSQTSPFRNFYFDLLEKNHIHVDYGGEYKNNIGYKVGGSYWEDEIINFMKQYKLVLAIENNVDDYYITEKIINPLKAGVVPIYYGSPRIFEFINKDRFIYIDENSLETSINKIREVLENENLWKWMIEQPIFVREINDIFNNVIIDCCKIL